MVEEEEGEDAVGEDGKAEDHVVEDEEAALVGEVGHHGFEVGFGVEEVILDGVDEDGGGGNDVQSTYLWHTYIL